MFVIDRVVNIIVIMILFVKGFRNVLKFDICFLKFFVIYLLSFKKRYFFIKYNLVRYRI